MEYSPRMTSGKRAPGVGREEKGPVDHRIPPVAGIIIGQGSAHHGLFFSAWMGKLILIFYFDPTSLCVSTGYPAYGLASFHKSGRSNLSGI